MPRLSDNLRRIPYLCDPTLVPAGICDTIVGYEAVYRICFALTCFFSFFSIIMLNVKNSNDPRSKLQNGFWFFKILFLFGLIVASFVIPYGHPDELNFAKVWMWFGMIGGVVFLLFQLILLTDTVMQWNEYLLNKHIEKNGCIHRLCNPFLLL